MSFMKERTGKIPFEISKNINSWIYTCIIKWDADMWEANPFFEEFIQEPFKYDKVMFDLDEVTYCNSRFLGYLFAVADLLEKNWGKWCIHKCSPLIYETCYVVWTFDVLPLFWNEDLAIKYLND
jgi:anti-anti-sigma regulatory factor